MQFIPNENLLQEKPHVKTMLDKLECSLRQFLVEHPEEDEEEIRRMAVDKLDLPYLNDFQTKFTRISIARKRSVWQQHLSNMSVERGLSFRKKEDLPAILSSYQEITNGPPSSLQALVDQTSAYNAKDKQTLPVREVILSKALANLRSYSNWLLAEFDMHMMHVYAIDAVKADDKFLCYSNSDVGKALESRISEKLGVCPEEYVHRLVMATGAKTRAHLLGQPSPSTPVSPVPVPVPVPASAPVPASSACEAMSVEVDNIVVPTETTHSYMQKKLMLVKSIRQVVHSMLEQVGRRRFQAVPWMDLLGGETGCLQLRNEWT